MGVNRKEDTKKDLKDPNTTRRERQGEKTMTYQELTEAIKNGRKTFTGEDLRNQSFYGLDLTDAYFSGADLRGADFGDTCLRWARFDGADLRGTDINRNQPQA